MNMCMHIHRTDNYVEVYVYAVALWRMDANEKSK